MSIFIHIQECGSRYGNRGRIVNRIDREIKRGQWQDARRAVGCGERKAIARKLTAIIHIGQQGGANICLSEGLPRRQRCATP